MNRYRRKAVSLIGLAVIFILWWSLTAAGSLDPIVFPTPQTVGRAFVHVIVSGELLRATAATLLRFGIGISLAFALGFPAGVILGRYQTIYAASEAVIEFFRPIPSAVIIPVAILLFGLGQSMKVSVIAYAALWPILLNTYSGIVRVDPVLVETGTLLGRRGLGLLASVYIPAALPDIFIGFRISWAIALIIAVTVEMIAGDNGLGYMVLDFERTFKYPEMYASIIGIGLIGVLLNVGFSLATQRTLKWHRPERAPL